MRQQKIFFCCRQTFSYGEIAVPGKNRDRQLYQLQTGKLVINTAWPSCQFTWRMTCKMQWNLWFDWSASDFDTKNKYQQLIRSLEVLSKFKSRRLKIVRSCKGYRMRNFPGTFRKFLEISWKVDSRPVVGNLDFGVCSTQGLVATGELVFCTPNVGIQNVWALMQNLPICTTCQLVETVHCVRIEHCRWQNQCCIPRCAQLEGHPTTSRDIQRRIFSGYFRSRPGRSFAQSVLSSISGTILIERTGS